VPAQLLMKSALGNTPTNDLREQKQTTL